MPRRTGRCACRRRPRRSCRPAPSRPWQAGASRPSPTCRRRRAGRCGRPSDRPRSRRRRPCTVPPARGPASARKASVVSARCGLQPRHRGKVSRVARFGQPGSDAGWRPGSDRHAEVPMLSPLQRSGTGKRPCRTTRARTTSGRISTRSEIFKDRPRPSAGGSGNLSNTIGAEQGIEFFGGDAQPERASAPPRPISSRPARSPSSPRPTCWSSAAARPARPRPSPPPASAPTCCWSSATTTWAASRPAASSSGSTA